MRLNLFRHRNHRRLEQHGNFIIREQTLQTALSKHWPQKNAEWIQKTPHVPVSQASNHLWRFHRLVKCNDEILENMQSVNLHSNNYSTKMHKPEKRKTKNDIRVLYKNKNRTTMHRRTTIAPKKQINQALEWLALDKMRIITKHKQQLSPCMWCNTHHKVARNLT